MDKTKARVREMEAALIRAHARPGAEPVFPHDWKARLMDDVRRRAAAGQPEAPPMGERFNLLAFRFAGGAGLAAACAAIMALLLNTSPGSYLAQLYFSNPGELFTSLMQWS